MLKIEVIRFEAEDVITASVEQPAECTCPDDRKADGSYNEAAGRCEAAGHPGCDYPGPKGHNCEYIA